MIYTLQYEPTVIGTGGYYRMVQDASATTGSTHVLTEWNAVGSVQDAKRIAKREGAAFKETTL